MYLDFFKKRFFITLLVHILILILYSLFYEFSFYYIKVSIFACTIFSVPFFASCRLSKNTVDLKLQFFVIIYDIGSILLIFLIPYCKISTGILWVIFLTRDLLVLFCKIFNVKGIDNNKNDRWFP